MIIEQKPCGEVMVIACGGEFTRNSDGASLLRDAVMEEIAFARTKIILNLERIDAIDSWGVDEIISCRSLLMRSGGRMVISSFNPKNPLAPRLVARMYTQIEIFPSEYCAFRSFF